MEGGGWRVKGFVDDDRTAETSLNCLGGGGVGNWGLGVG